MTGEGTVEVDGKTVNRGSSVEVESGKEVVIKFIPASDQDYVSDYEIDGTRTKYEPSAQKSETAEVKWTFTADGTIDVVFAKNGDKPQPEDTISWMNNNQSIPYVTALKENIFDAKVDDYALDSDFGTSWTYGVGSLSNPTLYSKVTYENSSFSEYDKREGVGLGKFGYNATNRPVPGKALSVVIPKAEIVPGEVTQTIETNYYTAKTVCGAHWYHVGGIEYHEVKTDRKFEILKDTITITMPGADNANKISWTYEKGKAQVKATGTPASAGIEGSQAVVAESDFSYNYEGINGTDYKGTTQPENPGTYKVTVTFKGTAYIEEETAEYELTITKADVDTTTVVAPVIESTEVDSVTLSKDSVKADQTYICCEVITMGDMVIEQDGAPMTGEELIANDYTFEGLKEGTPYKVKTYVPATDTHNESEKVVSNPACTKLHVTGEVEFAELDDREATVTFTDGAGRTFTAETVEGKYEIDLELNLDGIFEGTAVAEGKEGYEKSEIQEVSLKLKVQEVNFKMELTDKGKAKKFIDENLTDDEGPVTEVGPGTIGIILTSEEEWEKLPQEVKDEIDQLLSPKTYEELINEAKKFVDEGSNKFIGEHLTDKTGKIITAPSVDNFEQILGGEDDWNKLTQEEKDEVNRKLKEAGGTMTYEEMLAKAKEIKAQVEKEKAEKAKAEAEKAAKAKGVKTGDVAPILPIMIVLLASFAAIVIFGKKRFSRR